MGSSFPSVASAQKDVGSTADATDVPSWSSDFPPVLHTKHPSKHFGTARSRGFSCGPVAPGTDHLFITKWIVQKVLIPGGVRLDK